MRIARITAPTIIAAREAKRSRAKITPKIMPRAAANRKSRKQRTFAEHKHILVPDCGQFPHGV
jgi:hypothetical protein